LVIGLMRSYMGGLAALFAEAYQKLRALGGERWARR